MSNEKRKAKNLIQSALDQLTNENIFGIGKFNVILEKETIGQYKKTYYTVVENSKVLYGHLALFESATAIIKNHLMKKNSIESDNAEIVKLDEQYNNYLNEAANHKQRMNESNDSFQINVAAAKHGEAIRKMKTIKGTIKDKF